MSNLKSSKYPRYFLNVINKKPIQPVIFKTNPIISGGKSESTTLREMYNSESSVTCAGMSRKIYRTILAFRCTWKRALVNEYFQRERGELPKKKLIHWTESTPNLCIREKRLTELNLISLRNLQIKHVIWSYLPSTMYKYMNISLLNKCLSYIQNQVLCKTLFGTSMLTDF